MGIYGGQNIHHYKLGEDFKRVFPLESNIVKLHTDRIMNKLNISFIKSYRHLPCDHEFVKDVLLSDHDVDLSLFPTEIINKVILEISTKI
jgi:hypothetical protein